MDFYVQQFQDNITPKEEKFNVLTETLMGFKHVNEILVRTINELSNDIDWGDVHVNQDLTEALMEIERLKLLIYLRIFSKISESPLYIPVLFG